MIGVSQLSQLNGHLPSNPKKIVVCGTGKRHLETAELLMLEPTRYSTIVGGPESKNREKNTVILACGTEIEYELYSSVNDRAVAFASLINNLPSGTIVITSRPMISLLKKGISPKEAAIYQYRPDSGYLTELYAASNETEKKGV